MRPLQVWLPVMSANLAFPPFGRDAQRAFEAWGGEAMVWLLPGLRQPFRWSEAADDRTSFRVIGLPAEHVDRLDVFHVGDTGEVFGPGWRERFPEGRVHGLLDAWLNLRDWSQVGIGPATEQVGFPAPKVAGGRVFNIAGRPIMLDEEIDAPPETGIPVSLEQSGIRLSLERLEQVEEGAASGDWPPAGWPRANTISKTEAEALSALLQRIVDEGVETSPTATEPGVVTLHVSLKWPEPIHGVLPMGGGVDDLLAQARMRAIAALSQHDAGKALREAKAASARYLSEAESTLELVHFLPARVRDEQAAWSVAERFKLVELAPEQVRARDLRAAMESPAWKEALARPVAVRRAWGAAGFFWALLVDELEEHRAFMVCQRCGRLVRGKRGKRFCGEEDDPECFRQRRAADRRRERAPDRRNTDSQGP